MPKMPSCSRGLVRADAAQFERAVGGEQDQRHPGVVRLEHRGVQVGDRGAGGRDDQHRSAGLDGEAEGEKPGDPLVDANVQAHDAGRSNSAAASASACERDPGLSTTSRTPARTNSASSATANSVAGTPLAPSVLAVVVEVGELLLELADALVLLLVGAEAAQEGGVVIRCHSDAAAGCPALRSLPRTNQRIAPMTGSTRMTRTQSSLGMPRARR